MGHSQEATMNIRRLYPLVILSALLLVACGTDVHTLLSEDDSRAEVIEAVISDRTTRDEVIDRLLSTSDEREALFRKVVENDEIAGALLDEMLRTDRGKAVAASRIASDDETTRTFISMMMLTGAVGEIMTHEQAECLELSDAFAHGNQVRTMSDLKRLGRIVDDWARENGGAYPVCARFEDVTDCLASSLPQEALAHLRVNDAWGRPFQYHSDEAGMSYVLISYATDGLSDGLGMAGPTSSYDADIVFSNGDFVQWPGHILKEKIH
jgi:hypothetical protein